MLSKKKKKKSKPGEKNRKQETTPGAPCLIASKNQEGPVCKQDAKSPSEKTNRKSYKNQGFLLYPGGPGHKNCLGSLSKGETA